MDDDTMKNKEDLENGFLDNEIPEHEIEDDDVFEGDSIPLANNEGDDYSEEEYI